MSDNAVPPSGPELDAEVWTLLSLPKPGEEPKLHESFEYWPWKWSILYIETQPGAFCWQPAPLSTDPSTAFRALEIWRVAKAHRRWESYSPRLTGEFGIVLWEPIPGGVRRTTEYRPATFPHAVALALRAALLSAEFSAVILHELNTL